MKKFHGSKLNFNSLENIRGCMVVLYGQSLLHRLFHWKSFAVIDQSAKTVKLFQLEWFAINFKQQIEKLNTQTIYKCGLFTIFSKYLLSSCIVASQIFWCSWYPWTQPNTLHSSTVSTSSIKCETIVRIKVIKFCVLQQPQNFITLIFEFFQTNFHKLL